MQQQGKKCTAMLDPYTFCIAGAAAAVPEIYMDVRSL
jgi:hypothetical protein